MFIGSQAIHLLVLRKERESFERSSDARIRVLKDVIGRLQRGEDIDVKKVLGTGDEKQEKSWEDCKCCTNFYDPLAELAKANFIQ